MSARGSVWLPVDPAYSIGIRERGIRTRAPPRQRHSLHRPPPRVGGRHARDVFQWNTARLGRGPHDSAWLRRTPGAGGSAAARVGVPGDPLWAASSYSIGIRSAKGPGRPVPPPSANRRRTRRVTDATDGGVWLCSNRRPTPRPGLPRHRNSSHWVALDHPRSSPVHTTSASSTRCGIVHAGSQSMPGESWPVDHDDTEIGIPLEYKPI